MNDYGTALRNARQRRDITQTELARRSGIARKTVSDIELGLFLFHKNGNTVPMLQHQYGARKEDVLMKKEVSHQTQLKMKKQQRNLYTPTRTAEAANGRCSHCGI